VRGGLHILDAHSREEFGAETLEATVSHATDQLDHSWTVIAVSRCLGRRGNLIIQIVFGGRRSDRRSARYILCGAHFLESFEFLNAVEYLVDRGTVEVRAPTFLGKAPNAELRRIQIAGLIEVRPGPSDLVLEARCPTLRQKAKLTG
jgi:hypothetical protein